MKHHSTIGAATHAAFAAMLAVGFFGAAHEALAQVDTNTATQTSASATMPLGHARRIGETTRAWFDLQRTNSAAAPALPTPGAQATLAYERYLNSFRTKIPASYGSTLSGGGGALRVDYPNVGSDPGQAAGSN
jgi:hypothetical protein